MSDNVVERVSLCRVSYSTADKKPWLKRLADIDNEILSVFQPIDGTPRLFDNRDTLYWRDGPYNDGTWGIWEWSAKPNKNNPDSDFIETRYIEGSQIVEVIEIPKINTIDELKAKLVDGIECNTISTSVLICVVPEVANKTNDYEGLLCSSNNTINENGKLRIINSVFSLNVYSISRKDIISVGGRKIYRKLNCGAPARRVLVKEPSEIVRNLIIRRTSWTAVKPLGINKKAWSDIHDFINELPVNTLLSEISAECQCDENEANKYLESFLSQVDKYISHDDYDSSVIMAILESHPSLKNKCETIISEQWHKDNSAKLEEAKRSYEALSLEIQEKKRELDSAKTELLSAENQLEDLKNNINAEKKKAEDVTKIVQERIASARKDAASFIAEMAFLEPRYSEKVDQTPQKINAYFPGNDYIVDNMDYNHDWKETIETLRLELGETGISEQYALGFASFLYSTYVNHLPILLAGPNGESIAKAISISLFGKRPGIIDCSQPYSSHIIDDINEYKDPVYVIKYVFNNDWITHIPEIIKSPGYPIIVHPFIEDLFIEPKSLFSYILPIFTDLIVDSISKDKFTGAKQSDNYIEYERNQHKSEYNKLLSSVGFSEYAKSRIQAVISDFHDIMKSDTRDMDCLFAIFSYAFLVDKNPTNLIDKLSDTMKISDDLRQRLKTFMGLDDD